MPRGPRLDAPGEIHHVAARGIERGSIFRDDLDRADLLVRIARVTVEERLRVYAWSFLPNHVHLLVRSGPRPLGRCLQRILTGYAMRFNRRHERAGHLFQNRFASVLCDRHSYLLELIRYVHLNPIRHRVVRNEPDLVRYRWCGHGAMLGVAEHPWQATEEALSLFGGEAEVAAGEYRRFLVSGIGESNGHPLASKQLVLARGRTSGSRASGRETFGRGEWVLTECDRRLRRLGLRSAGEPKAKQFELLTRLVAAACDASGTWVTALRRGSRRPEAVRAREIVAHVWLDALGLPSGDLVSRLGVSIEAVRCAAYRGRTHPEIVEQILESLEAPF
jgi:putative transposase